MCMCTFRARPCRLRATPYSGAYVLFHVSFELMRVVCEAEGARCIASYRGTGAPRYAAVSGLNTTFSLALQVALQLLLLFGRPNRLALQTQFQLLASIFLALFACYGGMAVCRAIQRVGGGGSGGEDTVVSSPPSPPEQHYQRYLDSRPSNATESTFVSLGNQSGAGSRDER